MSRLEARVNRLENDVFEGDDQARFLHVPAGEQRSDRALQMFHDFARRGIELWIHPSEWAPTQPLWVPVTMDDLTDDDLQRAIDQIDKLIAQQVATAKVTDG